MFEVGFSEILVIFVLALVVLGPEKLPRLAAQAGRWIGRARAMAKQFRDQLEEEINVSDFNKAQAKASASPSSSTSSEPPPAAATPDPAASAHTTDSAQAHETPASAGTPEDDTVSHGHDSGPPAEPESEVYQPPAYANTTGANTTGANTTGANGAGSNGAHPTTPTEPGTTSPQPVESAHAEPHPNHKASHDSEAASDERPARPGDVITHTHERGI